MGRPPVDPVVRFWRLVTKSDGCWTWSERGRDKDGYGVFTVRHGKTARAHRFSYELEHGPLPKGVMVLHSCDNPPCVRPDHLFTGDAVINNRDCIAKGRGNRARGERVAGSKLTAEDVRSVRAMRAGGVSHDVIAAKFGVCRASVTLLLNGATWSHVK